MRYKAGIFSSKKTLIKSYDGRHNYFQAGGNFAVKPYFPGGIYGKEKLNFRVD